MTVRSIALSALLAAAPLAAADPTPLAKPLSAEDQQRLRVARNEARAAEKQGDHAAAAAAYRKAIALQPDDDRLLSELSWQLFLAKDLARAEETARKAIAIGGRARAASLYNLGRILEVKNDKAGAAKAYQESLATRPNRTVQQALSRVDPTATAAQVSSVPVRAGTDDALAPEELKAGGADKKCEIKAESRAAAGAIAKAQVVSCCEEYEACYQLVLHVGGKAFLKNLPMESGVGSNLEVDAQLAVDGGYLVVSLHRSEAIHGGRDKEGMLSWMHTNEEFVAVCGVGASAKPSCTPLFQRSFSEDYDEVVRRKWSVKMSLMRDALTLDADPKSRKKMDAAPFKLLGRHPLAFP